MHRAANQLFCSPAHRRAWDNRATVRGAKLFALIMVARATRNGSRGTPADRETGRRASSEANMLIQRWAEQDHAKKRMPWPIYLGRAYAAGRDPLT
ncbi:MAG: hypothetical protein EON59_01385 [Alphaproteobacteria bacterium]|nr:MAG: hypothetical protein EON59_01385 [Alphaproteobacteria bacterium]